MGSVGKLAEPVIQLEVRDGGMTAWIQADDIKANGQITLYPQVADRPPLGGPYGHHWLVKAPDEQTAIEQAFEKFKLDPRLAVKLIAEKTKGQPHRK